jgi:hypothetical protein
MTLPMPMPAANPSGRGGLTRAVDARGQVWVHPDPLELYRFIRARNRLLAAIAAGSPG